MTQLIQLILSLFTASLLTLSTLDAALLDTASQPSMGDPKAPIQVVVFLEPKCPDSKRYNNDSFPKLKSEFIDTNKVRYTVIITSFVHESMPAANALLCVYAPDSAKPNTDQFFKYLDYMYKMQPPARDNWAISETLLKFAYKADREIDQEKLKNCIRTNHYQKEVLKNTAYGNKLMGHLHVPALYVDGVLIENTNDTVDYDRVRAAINKILD